MEVPEAREFAADPVATVLADRGRYIAACLTVARAYIARKRARQAGGRGVGTDSSIDRPRKSITAVRITANKAFGT